MFFLFIYFSTNLMGFHLFIYFYYHLVFSSSVLLMGALHTGSFVWPACWVLCWGSFWPGQSGVLLQGFIAVVWAPVCLGRGGLCDGTPCARGLGQLSVWMVPLGWCFLTWSISAQPCFILFQGWMGRREGGCMHLCNMLCVQGCVCV